MLVVGGSGLPTHTERIVDVQPIQAIDTMLDFADPSVAASNNLFQQACKKPRHHVETLASEVGDHQRRHRILGKCVSAGARPVLDELVSQCVGRFWQKLIPG